jgi:hypothetical protein
MTDLEANLNAVQKRVADAARRVGRNPADIALVAVTKTVPESCVQPPMRIWRKPRGGVKVGLARGYHLAHDRTYPTVRQEISAVQVVHRWTVANINA